MNEKGLSISYQILKESQYPTYKPDDPRPVIAAQQLCTYLVMTCATVEEVIQTIPTVQTPKGRFRRSWSLNATKPISSQRWF